MTPSDAEQPTPPSIEEVDRVFLALAHEARRHVLLLLGQRGELPSGYLAARFQHSWPTTSRHLKVLEEAGLVEVRRQGRGSTYRLNRQRLKHVVNGWLRYLEPVGPDQRWNPSAPRSTAALAEPTSPRPPDTKPRNQRRTDGPDK